MPATQNPGLSKGFDTTTPIVKARFVKLVAGEDQTVEQCDTAGEVGHGVSMFSVSGAELLRGKGVSVIIEGRAVVIAAEQIDEGEPVATDGDGKAVVAASGDFVLGICDERSAGADTECSVRLADVPAELA